MDQIYDDVAREEERGKSVVALDEDLPGGGQFYCVETGRHFVDEKALESHKKTRAYKRRVKELREEEQYTQAEAESAAGMTREELPSVRGRGTSMQTER